jgi:hypothetical protein
LPIVLLGQARLAARNGIGLDTVLRRYFAAYAVMSVFLVEEAGKSLVSPVDLKPMIARQALLFERLLAAVCDEYEREAGSVPFSPGRRRKELVECLLAGEPVDASSLNYDLDGWHVAIVSRAASSAAIRKTAQTLGSRSLTILRGEDSLWAWMGSRQKLDMRVVVERLGSQGPSDCALAVGEPARGLSGWRLTHRQASVAFSHAVAAESRGLVRYAEVALLAALSKDDLLRTSLRQLYLAPLGLDRGGDDVVRRTLIAYFASGRKVSAAATALGVSRQTVTARLKAISERLGRPLEKCADELDVALQLARGAERSGTG